MAVGLELHSFVSKFLNLWSSGKNARLVVETQAGQATINLQLELGLPHNHHHPQEHHEKRVSPSRLRRRARREQARAEAAENAGQAQGETVAVSATEDPANTNPAAVDAAPTKKDAAEQVGVPALQEKKDAAVQVVLPTIESSVQAACPTVDEAAQVFDLEAAQALLSPPAVADMFCPDREFLRAGRAGHEHDGRGGRAHQQREEDRRKDLEELQKMLDNIGQPK